VSGMTPQGRLDTKCLYDWCVGMLLIVAVSCAFVFVVALTIWLFPWV